VRIFGTLALLLMLLGCGRHPSSPNQTSTAEKFRWVTGEKSLLAFSQDQAPQLDSSFHSLFPVFSNADNISLEMSFSNRSKFTLASQAPARTQVLQKQHSCDTTREWEILEKVLNAPEQGYILLQNRMGHPSWSFLTGLSKDVCQPKRFLNCLLQDLLTNPDALTLYLLTEAEKKSSESRVSKQERAEFLRQASLSLAGSSQRALACASEAQTIAWVSQKESFASPTPSQESLIIFSERSLFFLPSSLLSLSIYDGERLDYDKTLVESSPVALVPLVKGCADPLGKCVKSPLPREKCSGCEKLETGKKYTAFFIEKTGEPSRKIKRYVFTY
jgi:hypothetical protein